MKHVKIDRPQYKVAVVRHTLVQLRCTSKVCPEPVFTADFDEVQRAIACPSCGSEVFIPESYRGAP